jgi:hypothetical protein
VVKETKQITIKLNEEKFKPIIEKLMEISGSVRTPSELMGKCLWYIYCFTFQKISAFDNKTHFEYMLSIRKMTHEQFLVDCGKKYNEFMDSKKPF